jgi:hypothetical protein
MKVTTAELERNSTNRNIRDVCRGVNEFKEGYQPLTWEGVVQFV